MITLFLRPNTDVVVFPRKVVSGNMGDRCRHDQYQFGSCEYAQGEAGNELL
jgi:hypothetical protein